MQRLAIILGSTLSVIVLLRWAGKRSQRRAHRFDPLLGLRGSGPGSIDQTLTALRMNCLLRVSPCF